LNAAIRLEDVGVKVDSVQILDGISFEVQLDATVAFVGPNGAGKTTLLDVMCGLAPYSGKVLIDEGASFGRCFQGSPLPETLTVAEVAALAAGGREKGAALLSEFGLSPHAESFVTELSTGMRRILDLAVATAGSPQILMLDEPSSGLALAEIDQLAHLIRRWRDSTGRAVVLVEHDAGLVRAVADEVVVLEAGRIVARGSPQEVLASMRPNATPTLRSPLDAHFPEALEKVNRAAKPAAPLLKRQISTWTLLRLGLREFAAGLASVLILGVLNRVMKVELGISLGVVAAVLASYNLAAPAALLIAHRSDVRSVAGRKRTPYILGGGILAGLSVAFAPHVAEQLARGISPFTVTIATGLFIAMGVGMYGGGAVFFALLADLAPPEERGQAASVVYLELMAGILAGVGLTATLLDANAGGLRTLFATAAIIIIALTLIAVWGQERKLDDLRSSKSDNHVNVSFRQALKSVAEIAQARLFFVFILAATFFLFLQQAVLEPYGGDVLGLSVRATSAFNAVMTGGILVGMLVAGRPLARHFGFRRMAITGLVFSAIAFAGLAAAAAAGAAPPSWLAILTLGLAIGLFNVATLALMMGMTAGGRTALYMGAWTVAHALAVGLATAGGGLIFEAARSIANSEALGYASVFALESLGLALCIPLLKTIKPSRFAAELADAQLSLSSSVIPPERIY